MSSLNIFDAFKFKSRIEKVAINEYKIGIANVIKNFGSNLKFTKPMTNYNYNVKGITFSLNGITKIAWVDGDNNTFKLYTPKDGESFEDTYFALISKYSISNFKTSKELKEIVLALEKKLENVTKKYTWICKYGENLTEEPNKLYDTHKDAYNSMLLDALHKIKEQSNFDEDFEDFFQHTNTIDINQFEIVVNASTNNWKYTIVEKYE